MSDAACTGEVHAEDRPAGEDPSRGREALRPAGGDGRELRRNSGALVRACDAKHGPAGMYPAAGEDRHQGRELRRNSTGVQVYTMYRLTFVPSGQ